MATRCSSNSARRPLRLPPLAGSVRPRNSSGMRAAKPGVAHGRQRGDGLHQRLAGAAGFRDRDEARGRERQACEQRAVGVGIEIVHEMQARPLAQQPDARHAVAGELRQRLAAEARPAGAEDHDVARAVGQAARRPRGWRRDRRVFAGSRSSGRLPSAWRARSQASASPVRAERVVEGRRGHAVRRRCVRARA